MLTDPDRKRTKHELRAMSQMTRRWSARSTSWNAYARARSVVPEDWQFHEQEAPVTRRKTKVTIRPDADMVKWFRHIGLGYHERGAARLHELGPGEVRRARRHRPRRPRPADLRRAASEPTALEQAGIAPDRHGQSQRGARSRRGRREGIGGRYAPRVAARRRTAGEFKLTLMTLRTGIMVPPDRVGLLVPQRSGQR